MPEKNTTAKKSRRFNTAVWVLATVLVAGNIFVFCGPASKTPSTPSYSRYTYKEWQKARPLNLAQCIAALDTLVSDSAKQYYAALPEPYAVLQMKRAMGGQVYGSWLNNSNTFQQHASNGVLKRWFEKNDCREQELMQKVIWQSFFRHIRQEPWRENEIIDSLNRIFPAKRDLLSNYQLNYTRMYDLDDSVDRAYRVRNWPLNTVVYESTFSGGSNFKKKIDYSMTGVMIDRDTIHAKILVRVSSIEVNGKKRTSYQSGTDTTILEVGKSSWRSIRYMYRQHAREPFNY